MAGRFVFRRPGGGTGKVTIRAKTFMSPELNPPTTRREFLKDTGRWAALSALAGLTLPHVHAAADDTCLLYTSDPADDLPCVDPGGCPSL